MNYVLYEYLEPFFQAIFILPNFTYPDLGKAIIIASIFLHL